MTNSTQAAAHALPLTRRAVKPNYDLRKLSERAGRLAFDQDLHGKFCNMKQIQDTLRDMNAAYMQLLSEAEIAEVLTRSKDGFHGPVSA